MNTLDAIKNRRSIFPAQFSATPVADTVVWEILEAANFAPTHKKTEPWRFAVMATAEARAAFGQHLAATYKANTAEESFSAAAHGKYQSVATKASHVIAIGMHCDEQKRLPEWEELAATAMAVQNIWLAATALGVGGYWGSPTVSTRREIADYLGFDENTTCYGFFYLANHAAENTAAQRGDIKDKVIWKE
jgi:nitroreductase